MDSLQPQPIPVHVPGRTEPAVAVPTADLLRTVWRVAKTVLWLAGIGTTILVTVVGWLLYVFVDMRAKVQTIDDRVRAEVTTQVNDVRKELTGELKQAKEDAAQLLAAIEFERQFKELACQNQHDAALVRYGNYLAGAKNKEIPEVIRLEVCRTLLRVMYLAGRFDYLSDPELEAVVAVVRKDQSPCAPPALYNVAGIYAATGRADKGRAFVMRAIQLNSTDKNPPPSDDLVPYYVMALTIELAARKEMATEDRVAGAWAATSRVIEQYPVYPYKLQIGLAGERDTPFGRAMAVRAAGDLGDGLLALSGLVMGYEILPETRTVPTVNGFTQVTRWKVVKRKAKGGAVEIGENTPVPAGGTPTQRVAVAEPKCCGG